MPLGVLTPPMLEFVLEAPEDAPLSLPDPMF